MDLLEEASRAAAIVERLEGTRGPVLHVLAEGLPRHGRFAVLAGAFDPPTMAHVALMESALQLGFDASVALVTTRTVDKAETGLALADRIALLDVMARDHGHSGVLVTNRGLYVDQARILREAFPKAGIELVVGTDKLRQIFDRAYYDEFEPALERLFELVRLVVADRIDAAEEAVARVRTDPVGARFADRIGTLPFPGVWRAESSTEVRRALIAGESVIGRIPERVRAFLEHANPYARPAEYAARLERLRSALLPAKAGILPKP